MTNLPDLITKNFDLFAHPYPTVIRGKKYVDIQLSDWDGNVLKDYILPLESLAESIVNGDSEYSDGLFIYEGCQGDRVDVEADEFLYLGMVTDSHISQFLYEELIEPFGISDQAISSDKPIVYANFPVPEEWGVLDLGKMLSQISRNSSV